jgi:hypothetical protein
MQKALKLAIVAVTLVTLVVLTVAASALALTSTTTQSSPGMTERTIWDQTQVSIRKLTYGVNHTGPIHMELTFKPTTSDLDIYLLDSNGDALNVEQGCMGLYAGKEYIDYYVTDVDDQTIELDIYADDGPIEYMVGDTYYLVVVAFNGAASYQIWGYYPQIWLEDSEDVYETYNYYLQTYRFPSKVTSWATITGPRYGGAYDFRPTSVGEGTCRLEWPADIVNKVVKYDRVNAPMPANVEQYLYAGTYWDEVLSNWGTEENYYPDAQDGSTWYGFNDTYDVAEFPYDDDMWAQRVAHYVPSLYLAYENPLLGPDGPLDTGRTTMGYKAMLTYPENLWLKKVAKYSSYYKLYGRYSLDGAAVPIGTPIYIERKTATRGWATVKTVKTTNDLGSWSVKLSPGVTWYVRARALGNDTTGLEYEYSITRRLRAL